MRTVCRFTVLIAFHLMLTTPGAVAYAQEFRLESWVYVGSDKKPASESLTLFKDGEVYDFALPEFNETTFFDPKNQRFVLLDNVRLVRTKIPTKELLDFERDLREQPEQTKQAFLFNPKFKESYSEETRWLTLAGDQISYRAKLLDPKPADADVPRVYRSFADWYARLNAAYKGNVHSLARADLNRALAERGAVPEEVELTISPKGFGNKKVEIRSRHLYNWKLSENDGKRIEKARLGLVEYREVDLQEFKKSGKLAGKGR